MTSRGGGVRILVYFLHWTKKILTGDFPAKNSDHVNGIVGFVEGLFHLRIVAFPTRPSAMIR